MNFNTGLEILYEDNLDYSKIIKPPIILTNESLNYILANIKFNYLLIIFTMGCFTSLIFCYKKPISNKKFIIIPSYEKIKNLETDPILSKV